MSNEKPTLFELFIEKHPQMYTEVGQFAFKKGAGAMMGYWNDVRQLLKEGKTDEAIEKLEEAWSEYMRSL